MEKVIFFLFFCQLSLFGAFHESSMNPWGADSDLLVIEKKEGTQISSTTKKTCDKLIRFYQNVISPIDGPRSNYEPSSSEYTRQAICKYGFFKGVALGCDRLMRENSAEWHYPITQTERGDRKFDPLR